MKKILLTSHHNEAESEKVFGLPSVIVQDYKVFPFHAEGAVPVVVPALKFSKEELRSMVSMVDMVVLTGGHDVHTTRYGEEIRYDTVQTYSCRDDIEFGLLEAAMALKKPVFGICRGLQVINVFFGGSLHQNLHHDVSGTFPHRQPKEDIEKLLHPVTIESPSFLSRIFPDIHEIMVNSFHNQSVKNLGDGLKISAKSSDGIVEAIEHETYPIYAVQWHPEKSYRIDVTSQKLIRAVVKM
ncbi:MAG: gamma-glutamyl-gamma-aminobutyrate hydrolase family protein [Candidatus Magasanikbacteria bacterium]|nr:gamma-glutamyl-gamma-aminobutyrate hydrolase family protein [Candidatus Magasanikbacteria bacterium]